MQKKYSDELDPEVKLKMKKNLVYVSIFSIVMVFAGFTSAYIVSMGDSFWVKYPLPMGFWLSTGAILLSSLCYILANKFSAKGDFKKLKLFMTLTFLLGLGFVYFQFKGYSQLVEKGANPINPILVTEGRYGDYFEIKYLDKFIEVNANDFLIEDKVLTTKQKEELHSFLKPFLKKYKTGNRYKNSSSKFTLYYQGEPILFQNGSLKTTSGKTLKSVEMRRLQYLTYHVLDNRADFYYKGELSKDFTVYYKGKELKYQDRELYFGNKKLSAPLQLKINQSSDNATSYLYIISFLHLLHILVALIYLFRMVLITFKKTLTTDNQLSIRLGAIFWHFLGILWLYLLVFLLFIH